MEVLNLKNNYIAQNLCALNVAKGMGLKMKKKYIIVCIVTLAIAIFLFNANHKRLSALLILLLLMSNKIIGYYIQEKELKINNTLESVTLEKNIWDLPKDQTNNNLLNLLSTKYKKVNELKNKDFLISNFTKKGGKRLIDTYNICYISVVNVEEINEKNYSELYNILKNEKNINGFPRAVILLVNKKNKYYDKILHDLPFYYSRKVGYISYFSHSCLVVTGICFNEEELLFSILPFPIYQALANSLKNILLKIKS